MVILRRLDIAILVLRSFYIVLLSLPIKLANFSWSHFTSSYLRSPHNFTTTFSLQNEEQHLSIKSMQEFEASALHIGITQGIDDSSSSNESLVSISILSNLV
jgi:hypothetical protein